MNDKNRIEKQIKNVFENNVVSHNNTIDEMMKFRKNEIVFKKHNIDFEKYEIDYRKHVAKSICAIEKINKIIALLNDDVIFDEIDFQHEYTSCDDEIKNNDMKFEFEQQIDMKRLLFNLFHTQNEIDDEMFDNQYNDETYIIEHYSKT